METRTSRGTRDTVNAIDDYHETSYEDRVDDWIDRGLGRMKEMKERDVDEELPGAQSYDGLHIPAWTNDRLFGYQRVALHWMWDLHQQDAGGILGYVESRCTCFWLGSRSLAANMEISVTLLQ
jgi:hypothetical protein